MIFSGRIIPQNRRFAAGVEDHDVPVAVVIEQRQSRTDRLHNIPPAGSAVGVLEGNPRFFRDVFKHNGIARAGIEKGYSNAEIVRSLDYGCLVAYVVRWVSSLKPLHYFGEFWYNEGSRVILVRLIMS